MNTIITTLISLCKDIFIPSFCGSCRLFLSGSNESLCTSCAERIEPIANKDIILNKRYTMPVFALSRYAFPLKDLILNKHAHSRWGAHALGQRMTQYIPLDHMDIDICIPVPLHSSRLRYRGFNQAKLIAYHVADYKHAVLIQPIKRFKATQFQSAVPFNQRAKNVEGVFGFKQQYDGTTIFNKHILLIDDLMTTGSTLKEIAHLLIVHKPASITALVACRTP